MTRHLVKTILILLTIAEIWFIGVPMFTFFLWAIYIAFKMLENEN